MSAPVPFSDIGKPVSDLLGKDFPIGCAKLEINTLAANGVVGLLLKRLVFRNKIDCSVT